MKYFFQSMLGAMLLLSGVFAFSSCVMMKVIRTVR